MEKSGNTTKEIDVKTKRESIEQIREKYPAKETEVLGMETLGMLNSYLGRAENLERIEGMVGGNHTHPLYETSAKMLKEGEDRYKAATVEAENIHEAVREPLENLPDWARQMQNQVFTDLIDDYPEQGKYILQLVNPEEKELAPSRTKVFMMALFGEAAKRHRYEFIDKLVEKEADGKYTFSDQELTTFTNWYLAMVAKHDKENQNKFIEQEQEYRNDLEDSAEVGLLPEEYAKRAEWLNPKSPEYLNLRYSYADIVKSVRHYGADNDFWLTRGTYSRKNSWSDARDAEITFSINNENRGELKESMVLAHELTHAISGEAIEFGDNKEAARILNEALTEHISARISYGSMIKYDLEDGETLAEAMAERKEGLEFGSGETYEQERKILKHLQNGGAREIDPNDFYRAYLEMDEYREWYRKELASGDNLEIEQDYYEKRDMQMPPRRYGPLQQKLIDELLEAFPECQSLEDLGEMIVAEFKNQR